jgi:hypothetical protein
VVAFEVGEEEPAIGGDVYVVTHHRERAEHRRGIGEEHAHCASPGVRLCIENGLDPPTLCHIARCAHLCVPQLACA